METKSKEQFAFFWGGTFSNWAKSKFIIDGVEFGTCEQYMMYKKALMFGDFDMAKAIMETNNPREQKAFGRQVKGFERERWETYCREIVYDANVAKFTQNEDMKQELMFTVGRTLVESSPLDCIWGIGLAADDPLAQDRATWKGTNWLGEAIERVREDMISGKIKFEE
jgi:ribA/ribD-fused uncharacterized protein